MELQGSSSASESAQGMISRRWLPLVHAVANGAVPAAVVRLPPKPSLLPKCWAVGNRVEVRHCHHCFRNACVTCGPLAWL